MFKDAIINAIKTLKTNNTIYVLRGFNNLINNLDINFLFNNSPNFNTNSNSIQEYSNKIIQLANNESPQFIFFEDLLLLSNRNAGGIFSIYGKKLIIINNDFYSLYHPSISNIDTAKRIQAEFEKDSDNIYQIYYGDVQEYNNIEYVAYNDIHDVNYETINISDLINPSSITINTDEQIEIPDEFNALSFASYVTQVLDNKVSIFLVHKNTLKSNLEISDSKKKIEKYGISFKVQERKQEGPEAGNIERINDYLEILHRKNPNYDFRPIKIYENPYEGNTLTEISQAVIIDDLVTNSLLAQEQKKFKDIFVTAPTGAGKSVMFQIPAIYLAEKQNLLTIVVTPLIGLMKDQVSNISSMTDLAVTINSDYTPIEKEEALNAVRDGKKSILYISPETLLSNSDITTLIGDRKIGLVVVDEAHIVTTWGKNFRPDYWYLGDFINKIRNDTRTDTNFPIATFTATATFGLDSDSMYRETIESLKMTPNKYIGNVKRDDIEFHINHKKVDNDYMSEKDSCAINHIDELLSTGEKTLVYAPYTAQIVKLKGHLKNTDRVGLYHGRMLGGQKDETLESIINGKINGVLATKAFGMGIDIDDIKYVYHYAPTGNIADYVQEIGRAARKPGMIGEAITDYYKEDFRYINQLYGMSSIKNSHIIGVLKQIYDTYYKKGERNFMVSAEDFSWVFGDAKDIDDVDRRLKTTLLMIKKDFEADRRINYAPIIFKPRSMFTYGYFMIEDDFIPELQRFGVLKYFKKLDLSRVSEQASPTKNSSTVKVTSIGDTYQVDFKAMWEQRYRDISFGAFKYYFMSNVSDKLGFNFQVGKKLHSRVIIDINAEKGLGEVYTKLESFLDMIQYVFDDLYQENKYFSTKDLSDRFMKTGLIKKKYMADIVAGSIIPILLKVETYSLIESNFVTYRTSSEKCYSLHTQGYEKRLYLLKRTARGYLFGDRHHVTRYVNYKAGDEKSKPNEILISQILSMLEFACCDITSGSKPEFFIRVNNPSAIKEILDNPRYHSRMVDNVSRKHRESQILMNHFFAKLNNDTERWDFIEKYFLSQLDPRDYEEKTE